MHARRSWCSDTCWEMRGTPGGEPARARGLAYRPGMLGSAAWDTQGGRVSQRESPGLGHGGGRSPEVCPERQAEDPESGVEVRPMLVYPGAGYPLLQGTAVGRLSSKPFCTNQRWRAGRKGRGEEDPEDDRCEEGGEPCITRRGWASGECGRRRDAV